MKRQRIAIDGGRADLWSAAEYGAVRAVQAADDRDAELADVRRQFATKDCDVDLTSALVHQRAVTVLAASRKPLTEASYVAALNAVATAPATGRSSDPELESHLAAAAALSDLAEARLRERGVRKADDGYDDLFIAEVSGVSKQFSLPYRERMQ